MQKTTKTIDRLWPYALLLTGVIALAALLFFNYRPLPLEVETVEADQGIVETYLHITGEIASRHHLALPAPSSGFVNWYVREGEPVSLSQKIAMVGGVEVASPMDGHLVEVTLPQGAFAAPGQPLGSLIDFQQLVIEALVDEVDVLQLRVGQKVYWQIPGYPGRTFASHITSIAKTITREPGGNRGYKITFEAPDNLTLYPGMTADGSIVVGRLENATRIPVEALLEHNGVIQAFLVEQGYAKSIHIQVGLRNDEYVEIIEGIKPGDKLILPREAKFASGQKVVPKVRT